MEEYRSRKRPFNARSSEEDGGIADYDDANTGNNVVDLVTEEKKIPPNQKRTHANVEGCSDNNITPSIQQTGTASAYDDSDCDSDGGEDEDIPVIRDLQKSLEYLVSERNIEGVYNNCNGRLQQQQQQQQQQNQHVDEDVEIIHPNITETNQHNHQHDDEQLNKIPNLVNRILLEHYYSSSNNNHAPVIIDANNNGTSNTNHANPNSNMSRTQHEKMTQLLIAVIVEFAEPYYAKMTRYRQQERRRLLLLQQQQQNQKEDTQKKKRAKKQHHHKQQQQQQGESINAPSQDNNISSSINFDERAASWATSCLKQLLQPLPILSSSSSIPNFNTVSYGDTIKTNNDHENNNPHIPELDALLAASGSHDGMKMEEQIQNALIHGVHGRRLLESMGM